MTLARITELRTLRENGTPGEWHDFFGGEPFLIGVSGPPIRSIAEAMPSEVDGFEDVALIVGAVNALPELLDAIDRLRAENGRLQSDFDAAVKVAADYEAEIEACAEVLQPGWSEADPSTRGMLASLVGAALAGVGLLREALARTLEVLPQDVRSTTVWDEDDGEIFEHGWYTKAQKALAATADPMAALERIKEAEDGCWWLIYFADAEMRPEIFGGAPGAKESAIARFKSLNNSWTVSLFRSVRADEIEREGQAQARGPSPGGEVECFNRLTG